MLTFQLNRLNETSGRYYEVSPLLLSRFYGIFALDAVKYPSVTTLLNKFMDKSKLKAWEAKVGKQEAERVRKQSAQRGTTVHQVVESYWKGKKIPAIDTDSLPFVNTLFPALKHFQPLLSEQEVFWVDAETPFIGYAGTLDAVATIDGQSLGLQIDQANVVLDFKTWRKPKNRKDLYSYCYQLAAYAGAVNHLTRGLYRVNSGAILGVTPDTCKLFVIYKDDMFAYWESWLRMVKAYFLDHPFDWNEEIKSLPLPEEVSL